MESQKISIFENGGNISENDLKEIFTTQYNAIFSKIIKKSLEDFFALLKQQIILHLRIIDKQCESSLLSSYYEKYYDICKEDHFKIKKIFEEIKSYNEKDLNYLNILDIYVHCYKCKEVIHKCGSELIVFDNFYFCLKCHKVYNKDYIKLFCNHCKNTYITTKRSDSEKKYDYFYSISFTKYHCFTENEEKIKCLNCGNDLYYNINNSSSEHKGMRDIFCIKCKLIFDTKEIFFSCKICGENFKGEPQIYRNFPSIKKYLLLLVNTFRKNIYALPDIITNKKCNCDLNGVQYFLHKDNGRLYEGNKNGKSVIICDHCYGIFKTENFNWNCPFCGGNFKAIKKCKNMKFDKNRKKIFSNTSLNILKINNDGTNKKDNMVLNKNNNNHSFYTSLEYSSGKNYSNSINYESAKQLINELSFSNKERRSINIVTSKEIIKNETDYKSDKRIIISKKGTSTNIKNSNVKRGISNGSNNQKLDAKYKQLKPVKLFANKERIISSKRNNDNLNEKPINTNENNSNNNINKRAMSYYNKNINKLNDNSSSNIEEKNRAISSYKKVMLNNTDSLFNIKESLREESSEYTQSDRRKLENVLPQNIILKNKNNNCNNNNISISINNNVIQLSCPQNIKKNKNIQKNKNVSPEINIMGDNENNIIINNKEVEIYHKKKIEKKESKTKENKMKGKSAQKNSKYKLKEEDNEQKKEKSSLNININSKISKEKLSTNNISQMENKENKKKTIINNFINYNKRENTDPSNHEINSSKKLIKGEKTKVINNRKLIKKEITNKINNKKLVNNSQSEKKPNIVTKLNLAIKDEKNQPKPKNSFKQKLKVKKLSDNRINKVTSPSFTNSSKNPNVFIITNLSRNNQNNDNNSTNNSVNKNTSLNTDNLNILSEENNNFVYTIRNSKSKGSIERIKEDDEENAKPNNFIYTSKNNQINAKSINPISNKDNDNEIKEVKKENSNHKKNNSNFHVNNVNSVNSINNINDINSNISNDGKNIGNNNSIKNKKVVQANSKNKNDKIIIKNKNINNENTGNIKSKQSGKFIANNIGKENNSKDNINKTNNIDVNNNIINSGNNIKISKIINIGNSEAIDNIIKNNYNTIDEKNINKEIMNNYKSDKKSDLNLVKKLNFNDINNISNLRIYFSSMESEISKKHRRNPSFDIRCSKNHFKIFTNSDNLEVKSFDSNYYTILRQIGKGSYGKIYLVEDPKTQEQFALKKIIIGDALELKENQDEYKLTWKLTKLNPELKIVKKYAIEIKKLDKYNLVMYVLMEAANCDWEQELINRQKDNAFYTELELIEILKSLVNTFAELQKRGISHRDVKPQNILCFGKDGYKLSDFGEAKTKKKNYKNLEIDENTRKQTVRGTELYMSPILFKALQLNSVEGAQYNAYKSDVFSLGMCFLLASSLNYQSLFEIREVYDMKIIKEVVEKYLGKMYSQNYINLVLNMLQINEKLRPDFIELNSMIV